MKLRAFVILLIIIATALAIYYLSKYLQKIIRPRESFGKLLLYMGSVLGIIFIVTFLIVLIIGKLFHDASG